MFGFEFHETLCPCGLINVKDSELDSFICSDCTEKLRLDYNGDFLGRVRETWTGDFEDFLGVLSEDRLTHLRSKHIHTCNFNYADGQLLSVIRKIDQMIENFQLREDERIDAKIESRDILLDLSLN